jgi:hypothetical protein
VKRGWAVAVVVEGPCPPMGRLIAKPHDSSIVNLGQSGRRCRHVVGLLGLDDERCAGQGVMTGGGASDPLRTRRIRAGVVTRVRRVMRVR